MAGLRGENLYWEELCAMYEEHFDETLFADRVETWVQQGEVDPIFHEMSDWAVLNLAPVELQREIMQRQFGMEPRRGLLYMQGFQGREADELMDLPNTFHGRGKGNTLRKLTHDEAVQVAAFLESSVSFLMGVSTIPSNETAWYQYLRISNFHEVKKVYEYLAKHGAKNKFLYGAMELGEWVGRDCSQETVGYVVMETPDFTQISLSTDYPGCMFDWKEVLLEFGWEIGINEWNLPIYTAGLELLRTSGPWIYRLTWPKNYKDKTRALIYSRIFSTRSLEMQIGDDWIRFPVNNWRKAVTALINWHFGQIRPDTADKKGVHPLLDNQTVYKGVANWYRWRMRKALESV